MDIQTPLFYGEHICLAPIDHEKDPDVEARWTQDAGYLRMLNTEPATPMSVYQVKKKYEAIEKAIEEHKNTFYFTIRMRSDDRLIGFVQLYSIEWNHAVGRVKLGIGEANHRGCGYGTEVLQLILRYVFEELNLFRLGAIIPEYNLVALRLFEKADFVKEVCRREALNRDLRRWDLYYLGILHEEWQARLVSQE